MARRRFQGGSLFKRGKRQRVWVGRWREGILLPDGSLGRIRRAEVLGTVAELPTLRAAMAALSERIRPINNGAHRPQLSRKFAEFMKEDWEPVVLPTLKYSTQEHYRYLLSVHLVPAFGEYRLCDISREAVQAFLQAKLQKGLSWKTVSLIRNGLGQVLASAEEWGYIRENLARKTKLPGRELKEARATLTPDQVRQLIDRLSEPTRSLVLLLVTMGLRIGELLALRWRNVDLEAGVIRVRETVYDGRFDTPKSWRSFRAVPLGNAAAAVLKARVTTEANPDALIFASSVGTPLNRRNLLRRHLQPACKALKLPRISWHTLRHSNATFLDAVGAPPGQCKHYWGTQHRKSHARFTCTRCRKTSAEQ